MAALSEKSGYGLGSGRSWERAMYAAKKVQALKDAGHEKEASLLEAAINVSIRGAYEIARLPDEALFALCKMVADGFGSNLVQARRWYQEMIKQGRVEGSQAVEPVTVSRCKDDMYRIASLRNHSSILVSAQDLLDLSEILDYLKPELKEKTNG